MNMKQRHIAIICISAVILSGCRRDEPAVPAGKVSVELSGVVGAAAYSKGAIVPGSNGLPPFQLSIGIVTTNYSNQSGPSVAEWADASTYLDPGFFGGPGLGVGTVTNGEIQYLNAEMSAVQKVFYDEMGVFYFLRAVYPYQGASLVRDAAGATVIFPCDGSQDILSSEIGWGNKNSPMINNGDPLAFSHKLTMLNCRFIAESEDAAQAYGDITSVELTGQPDQVGLNIGSNAISVPATSTATDYPMVDSTTDGDWALPFSPGAYDAADAKLLGYMLAVPARNYTFRITTQQRGPANPIYAAYDFGSGNTPASGTIYNLTFKMLETAEIVLTAAEAEEWWLDQTFN